MTPPEFSVLLLAWDDADPTVAVLGGAALPPTLPLVYQLAARQPVLAVYPHLPANESREESAATASPETAAAQAPAASAAAPATAVAAAALPASTGAETSLDALATAVNGPGVQVLAALASGKQKAAPVPQSRIIGLTELAPADAAAAAEPATVTPTKPVDTLLLAPAPAPSRSQWPTGIHAPVLAGRWQTPAAPYLGAEARGDFPPPPPAPPRPAAAVATAAATASPIAAAAPGFGKLNEAAPTAVAISPPPFPLRPRQNPQAGDLNFDPDPELPAVQQPAVFEETTAEIGAGEAADISASEDDLVPDAPAAAEAPETAPAATPTLPEPAAPAVRSPRLDGLNFRMIQYARQAAQLVRGRSDFGVIYAPSWPAWLAALEIRTSSGRPLVLYVAGLALDLPNPAEHGYQLEMERMALRRARLVLVPDAALRRRLLALYEYAADKVRVVAAHDDAAVQQALGEVAAS